MKDFGVAFLLLVLMFCSVSAKADSCPQGTITNPIGAGGQSQCVPGANHQNWGGSSSSQGTRWANRWGAIAYDPSTGSVGIASSQVSKRKAVKEALNHCRSKGGIACKINIDYYNQCVAVVSGAAPTGGGVLMNSSSAPTETDAEASALKVCEKGSGASCKTFYIGCSYAEQI